MRKGDVGVDFTASSGTLTFSTGEVTKAAMTVSETARGTNLVTENKT